MNDGPHGPRTTPRRGGEFTANAELPIPDLHAQRRPPRHSSVQGSSYRAENDRPEEPEDSTNEDHGSGEDSALRRRGMLAYANEIVGAGDRLKGSANLQTTKPLLRLLALVTSVPMAVEGLISGVSAEHFWGWVWVCLAALMSIACIWRRDHWSSELFSSIFGIALLNAGFSALDTVSRGETICSFVVILLWTGMFVRPTVNLLLAVYALGGFSMFGGTLTLNAVANVNPNELPVAFGLLFVAFPVALGAGLKADVHRANIELERNIKDLQAKRNELEALCAEQSDRVDRSHAQLVQSQRLQAVGTMASGLAHELNNILTPIRGLGELLTEGVSSRQASRYGANILDAAIAAAQITGSLLTYSRQGTYNPVRSELASLLQLEIIPVVASALPAPFQLTQRFQSDIYAEIDRSLLQNCIHQLVLNAVDAYRGDLGEIESPSGSDAAPLISIELMRSREPCEEHPDVEVAALLSPAEENSDNPNDSAVIVVRDAGCGIPTEALPRIFEPFFTTKRVGSGAGLGLPTVHGTISRHGGRVALTSELGIGTTVVLQLPLVNSGRRAKADDDESPQAPPQLPVVYVLSEDDDFRDEVEELLDDARYDTRHVQDLSSLQRDLATGDGQTLMVLLDMEIEGQDPEQTFARLRESLPNLPIALVSERSADQRLRNLARRGPTRTVRKPIDRELILPVLRMLTNPESASEPVTTIESI